MVVNKILLALESVKAKVKVGFSKIDIFKQTIFSLYAIKYMSIFGGKFPIRYPFNEI